MSTNGHRTVTRRQLLKTGLALAGATLAPKALFPKPFHVLAQSRAAVTLGVLLPYSGVYAQLGEDITNGMTLYFEQVGNQAGGRPIQMIREDETADPAVAVSRARKLVESDQVDMMTGLVSTAAAYAMRDYIHDSRTILLVSNAGGNALTRDRRSPYIFRTSFTSWQVGFPMGTWVKENLADRVFIIASDYAFGHETAEAFRESFVAAGGTVVDQVYTPLGSTDFGGYMSRIAGSRPQAVFGFLAGSDGVIFVRQFHQFVLSRSIHLAASGFMVEEDVLRAVGAEALGAYSSLHWAITLPFPENQAFVQAYRARFGANPSVYSMQGYDTARVIVEALNATGGDTSNKERLVEALRAVRFNGPRGLFEFDPRSNHVIQNTYVRQVRRLPNGEINNEVIADLGRFIDPV